MALFSPEKPKFLQPKDDGSHDDLNVHPEKREAEVADLEEAFNSPATQNHASEPEKNELESLDSGDWETNLKSKPKKRRFRLTGKQVAATGAGAGLLVGGTIGFLTFFAPIGQFIHIAKLMQNFHFFSQEEAGDIRSSKMLRRAFRLNGDDSGLERTRLGRAGNLLADRFETKLNKDGLTSHYRNGYLIGYTVDVPTKFTSSKLPAVALVELAREYEIPVENITVGEGRTLQINVQDMGYFQIKKLLKAQVATVGVSRTSAAIRARIMVKRAGISLHPIKALDRRLTQAADARLEKFRQWREDRIKYISEGVDARRNITIGQNDEEGKPSDSDTEEARRSKAELDIDLNEAPEGRIAKIGAHPAMRSGANATDVVGFVCTVYAINKALPIIHHTNVVLPLMRMGMEIVSVGNQVMFGSQDGVKIDLDQLGFYANQLYDETKNSSWSSARSIQGELGQELTGPDIDARAKVDYKDNAVGRFLRGVRGIDGVCGAASSVWGQAFSFAIGFAGGPISAIAGEAVGQAFGEQIVQGIIGWLAADPIDIDVAGADYGNYFNYGARLAANDSFIAAGGAKLSDSSVAEWKQYRNHTHQQQQATKNIAERLINPYNPRSLVSQALDKQSPNPRHNIARMATSPIKAFGSLLRTPKTILFPVAAAQNEDYTYDFDLYGFTLGQLESEDLDDPYDNGARAVALLSGSNGDEYKRRAKTCFGIEFDSSNNPRSTGEVPSYTDIENQGNCDSSNQDWLRIRMYIFDTQISDAMACYEGDDASCSAVDAIGTSNQSQTTTGSQVVGNVGESSDNVPCAAGTNDLGVVESKYTGALRVSNPLVIRLCQVPAIGGYGNDTSGSNISGGAVVNSRVSGAWHALAQAASAEGVQLSASSSFRLADSCGGTGDGGRCAAPGSSNHQLGIAIDFDLGGQYIASATCDSNRSTADTPAWNWLARNAERFGFKQYAKEAWHWDTAERGCGAIQ